jgi:hypothetical protein
VFTDPDNVDAKPPRYGIQINWQVSESFTLAASASNSNKTLLSYMRFEAHFYPEDGGSRSLQNVGNHLQDFTDSIITQKTTN